MYSFGATWCKLALDIKVAGRLLPADVPALINQLLVSHKIGAEELEQVKKLREAKEREERNAGRK